MPAAKNLVGQRFGLLTVIGQADNINHTTKRMRGLVAWNCLCDCGSIKLVSGQDLRRQHTRSCGCLRKFLVSQANTNTKTKHGLYTNKFIAEHGYVWYHRLNNYNLTVDEFNSLVVKQNNVCAICFQIPTEWHVDHDHSCCKSNKSCGKCVRGLLCRRCNLSIGAFEDNIQLLQSAITYLSR